MAPWRFADFHKTPVAKYGPSTSRRSSRSSEGGKGDPVAAAWSRRCVKVTSAAAAAASSSKFITGVRGNFDSSSTAQSYRIAPN